MSYIKILVLILLALAFMVGSILVSEPSTPLNYKIVWGVIMTICISLILFIQKTNKRHV